MSIWIPNLDGRPGPVYRAIVDCLAEDVRAERVAPGTRLPPQRDLAWRLKVTVGTVARAYAEAERQGLVSGEVGRGTFVRDPKLPSAVPAAEFFESCTNVIGDGRIDLAVNHPSGNLNAPLVANAMMALAQRPYLADLLQYRLDPGGPLRTRAAASAWLAFEGVEAPPERCLMTIGGQQAILCAVAALVRPGDALLAEELSYPGPKTVTALLGRRLEPITIDEQGMVPAALDQALSDGLGNVVYVLPTNHNPTTVTMPLARRQAIVEICRRHDVMIIEDGIYNFLLGDALPPLAQLAPERTFYLSSLSKSVAPGLRAGTMAVPDGWISRIAAGVTASSLVVPPLMAEIAAMLIETGDAMRAAESLRADMELRCDLGRQLFGPKSCRSRAASNLWVEMPPHWRSDAFVTEASRRGVAITPGGAFAIGHRNQPDAVRISLSVPSSHEELKRGLNILHELLQMHPDGSWTTV